MQRNDALLQHTALPLLQSRSRGKDTHVSRTLTVNPGDELVSGIGRMF